MMMMQAIDQSPFSLKHTLIWAKNNHVLSLCDYNYKHEPILYGWKKKGTHKFYGKGQCKTSVWNFDKPLANKLHPTMKPVELVVEAILNSSEKDNLLFEPFSGSGSTLIACEKTNRKCKSMEIDPHYVSVVLQRYIDFVGSDKEVYLLDGEKRTHISEVQKMRK
jgi:ParB family chromosome partitioning protein